MPELLILISGIQKLLPDYLVQVFLSNGVGTAVFLAVPQVGAANVADIFGILQLGSLSGEGSSAVAAGDESAVSQNGLLRACAGIPFLPLFQKHLRLRPYRFGNNGRQEILVAELL